MKTTTNCLDNTWYILQIQNDTHTHTHGTYTNKHHHWNDKTQEDKIHPHTQNNIHRYKYTQRVHRRKKWKETEKPKK